MKKSSGKGMILTGGILEAILAIAGILLIILYLANANSELMTSLNIAPETGLFAMFGLYGITLLHLISAVIAFVCCKNPEKYVAPLLIGIILIALTNVFTDWQTANAFNVGLNILPGALIAGGAWVNRNNLAK